jgi:hypothetical protein
MALLCKLSLCLRPNVSPPLARLSDDMVLLSQNPVANNNGGDLHTEHTIIDEKEIEENVRRQYAKSHRNVERKQAVEIPHFMATQDTANLDDLRNILYTRERLEGMGCRFATNGELVKYGETNSLQEFDHMLRLGPVYDAQWQAFFDGPVTSLAHEDAALWSDLRTLKRLLKNEGVEFGWEHRRITQGDFSYRMIRLCNAYDDLRKIWSATAQSLPRVPITVDKQEEDNTSDTHNDNGFEDDVDSEGDARGTVEIDRAFDTAQLAIQAGNSVPRNIGWRFSDDIDEVAVDSYRDSINDGTFEELEEALQIAMAVPLPDLDETLNRPTSPVQHVKAHVMTSQASITSLRVATQNPLRYGPSPLQVINDRSHKNSEVLIMAQTVTTSSMLINDEIVANPRSDNTASLGLDTTIVAAMSSSPSQELPSEEQPKRKRSIKGWFRGVFGGKQWLEGAAANNKGINDVRKTMGIGESTYAWF